MLVKSLGDAVADLTKRLGPDMQQWNLGAYHYSRVLSPFTAAVRPDLEAQYDVGHAARGGDSYTINATGGTDNQPAGGSFKIVMDTENWDNSVGLNNPGQSGDIASPHYRDLYELWARGKYFLDLLLAGEGGKRGGTARDIGAAKVTGTVAETGPQHLGRWCVFLCNAEDHPMTEDTSSF